MNAPDDGVAMNTMAPNGKVKQHIPKELRYSMRNFMNDFPNDAACLEYLKEQRFPGGVTQCLKCGVEVCNPPP